MKLYYGLLAIVFWWFMHRAGLLFFFCPFCFLKRLLGKVLIAIGSHYIRKSVERSGGQDNFRLILERELAKAIPEEKNSPPL